MVPKMRETDMHTPLMHWLEGQGYRVSAEVRDCDLVARHPHQEADPVIFELKVRMSLDLIAQGVRRQEVSPTVYLVVPLHGSRGRLRNARSIIPVLRRLELGLIFVRFLKTGSRVEVHMHPEAAPRRSRPSRRRAILREIDGRYAELNRAGQTRREEQFSAYRQRAIRVAALLRDSGRDVCSPRELRDVGAPESVQQILSRNHYGWFDRVGRGSYRLNEAGRRALERYTDILPHIIDADPS
ncbi:MAG: DUF2161 family putative PD-(D/E)XK-type phosphodiesterase [Alkalispirochaeta sp.]